MKGKVKLLAGAASRGYPLPECKGCDFLSKKDMKLYTGEIVKDVDFCTAFVLHLEWVAGILEGEPCYKAMFGGVS